MSILLNYGIFDLRVIVCFIEQTKKQGNYTNPFNFKVGATPFSRRYLIKDRLELSTPATNRIALKKVD